MDDDARIMPMPCPISWARLGVKARAAGISLVFAAQRPDATCNADATSRELGQSTGTAR